MGQHTSLLLAAVAPRGSAHADGGHVMGGENFGQRWQGVIWEMAGVDPGGSGLQQDHISEPIPFWSSELHQLYI